MEFVLDWVVRVWATEEGRKIFLKSVILEMFSHRARKRKKVGVGWVEIKPNMIVPVSKSTLIWRREGFVTLLGGLIELD